MRRLLVAAVLLVLVSCTSTTPVRVLFVGNSYTHSNDLPGVVETMAESQGIPVEVEMQAPGGWWLRDHAASPHTLDLISQGDFDYVVLQEQSMVPSVRRLVETETRPAARALATRANQSGATVVLFMTWGHRSGSADVGHTSYESMQRAIIQNYERLGEAVLADVAPAGTAWWMSLNERPGLPLHQPDGSHPNARGTYLAAAAITGTLFDLEVADLGPVGIDQDEAEVLRSFAARALDGERP